MSSDTPAKGEIESVLAGVLSSLSQRLEADITALATGGTASPLSDQQIARWQIEALALAGYKITPTGQGPAVDYDGPEPSVECAWPPCTNRLLRRDGFGPQWCSAEHRAASVIGSKGAQ